MNTDCSTHPKGTNKKRARCACFRLFAVVIRHPISRPQRCQNLRQTSQQKFEGMRKSRNGYEGSPFDDQIAVPRRNAVDGGGYFLHVHIRLDGRLTNDHLSESSLSASFIGYEKRESRESEVFLRLKSLICRKKRTFGVKYRELQEMAFVLQLYILHLRLTFNRTVV